MNKVVRKIAEEKFKCDKCLIRKLCKFSQQSGGPNCL
ncbi:hypothetical protein EVA_15769, partial [gut metagenome]